MITISLSSLPLIMPPNTRVVEHLTPIVRPSAARRRKGCPYTADVPPGGAGVG